MSENLFRRAQFQLAAHELRQLPADRGAEIAFAGRSNAGKSSALNTLCDQTGLARTSKTPGRTQQLVVFTLDADRRLIDLPGYGYAKVPEALRDHWRKVIDQYLSDRQSLRGVVLIMDSRHPLKDFDRMMLTFCRDIGLPCHVLMTKVDKLSRGEAARTLQQTRKEMGLLCPDATAQLFSSLHKIGVDEARATLAQWLNAEPAEPDAS
ncbi:ribosome biogenesis GTP-binding protein YihA/YsxC [Tahibacter amnicola]|uniref:Probable GTP-binding protein EngB n=1 Tax=Tahibacter amnicola TaxID=2976241 RepID=A0ABY6BK81_9GAMM|nr:ribosome biogenesis GTP-binding protein YihA/YsxC [Tahibacter amnicola]UXI68202.1 ribosome biogenesis GTP-binding protein YihA/YsxC [Tahibacter amnicola]